jgi:hypothetical protein
VAAAVEPALRDLILLRERQHQVKVILVALDLGKVQLAQQAAAAVLVALERQVQLALPVMVALVLHHLLQVHLLLMLAVAAAVLLLAQQVLVEVQ